MFVTKKDIAAFFGKTERTIYDWENAGMPVYSRGDSATPNQYESTDVLNWYIRWRISKQVVTVGGESYDNKVENARLRHHQANNEALKEAETAGRLLPVEEVIDLGRAMVNAAKTKFSGMASRVRQSYPDVDNEIISIIEQTSQEALEELGRDGIPPQYRERISKYRTELDAGEEAEAE